jgi:hypothetical protein
MFALLRGRPLSMVTLLLRGQNPVETAKIRYETIARCVTILCERSHSWTLRSAIPPERVEIL